MDARVTAVVPPKGAPTRPSCGLGSRLGRLDFDLWRQMTVEHLIGDSQGGYPRAIRASLLQRFPDLAPAECDELVSVIDESNTVSACSFCNSTTSRTRAPRGMDDLILNTPGGPGEVVAAITAETEAVLAVKRGDVRWKIESVRMAFNETLATKMLEAREGSTAEAS